MKSSQSSSWNHVDEPCPPGGMERDQVRAAVAGAQARAPSRAMIVPVRVAFRRPVAAEDPDDARVLVALAEPLAVRSAFAGVKISGPTPHFLFHLSPHVGSMPT